MVRASSPSLPRRLGRLSLAGAAALSLATGVTPAFAADPTPTGSVPPPAQTGKFVPTTPTRILDTRHAIGVPGRTPVANRASIRVDTGLVAADVTAVVMNVTVTDTTGPGFLTVYPDGTQPPTTSNLNFTAGQTVPNLVTVPVTNGHVDFYNFGGSTDVIADLAGYYTDSGAIAGSSYVPLPPSRALDTRSALGTPKAAPIGQRGTLNLKLAGTHGIPPKGATAVVLNVTATRPSTGGFLTVYPHGTALPTTSNLNFTTGQTVPNLVTVPLGADGSVDVYNFLGTTDVVADVFGYYQSAPTGAGFTPTGPKRMVDTRDKGHAPIGPGGLLQLPVATGGLGTTKVSAVVLNVTAVNATKGGYLTVFPGNGTNRPTTSNLNFGPKQVVPNMVVVPVDDSGLINIYNFLGTTDVVVDLFGYFTDPVGGPTGLSYGGGNAPVYSCGATAPGRWATVAQGDPITLGMDPGPFRAPGQLSDTQIHAVVTDPSGKTTDSVAGNATLARLTIPTPLSGAYSWYAYATDGTKSSPPSKPCYFQADGDSVITGVQVTSNTGNGPTHTGDPLTLTFKATSTGSTDGKKIASFCYAEESGSCTQIPADANGQATVNTTAGHWGTHVLYVQAFTVSGWVASTTSSYYVAG
ncbi:hypothetical protein CFP65_4578 [Kitasatospora sp. MMS16-BH015]|uniref:hypothetical protein n=1 Tax=Kitasatospora sp. MMS16-BH015 TaxID=2018025 RepID=UPI000CA2FE3C|nr:hypothetical protein [Kitasatospora sp. MMS16-BH015]AUG79315.1 hypothetical protein CFP65_4578 [Kitasatospora sp. MMS16-BH015]